MRHLAMIGLAVLVVFAFACSTQDAGKMECKSCPHLVEKPCPKVGMAASCDKCPK